MKVTLIIFIITLGFSCIETFIILPSINRIAAYNNDKQQYLHLNHVDKNNYHNDLKMIYRSSRSSGSSSPSRKTFLKNTNQPVIHKIITSLFSTPVNIEVPISKSNINNNDDDDLDNVNTIDRNDFIQYYRQIISDNNQEMTKEQLINYKIINQLLIDKLIYIDDVNDLWISVVGDSIGVNEDEGYELVCMIKDLPDPEILEFYNQEYLKICKEKKNYNNDGISFFDVLNWSEMKTLINDDMITMEEISNIWKLINNDNLNSKINKLQFNQLNRFIDDLLEKKEEDGNDTSENVSATSTSSSTAIDADTKLVSTSNNDISISSEIDVWSSSFNPKTVFDVESLEEITSYYVSSVGGTIDNEITYESLLKWNDIIEMIQEGSLTIDALNIAWNEAINTKQLLLLSSSTSTTSSSTTSSINYDQFLRLNVRLDLLMDEIEAKNEENKKESSSAASLSMDTSADDKVDLNSYDSSDSSNSGDKIDAESFYRSEFNKITSGGSLMRLDMLLSWKEIADLIADGSVSEKQITRLFDSMPKEPMGLPSTIFGITETTFINFNNMLDVLLDVTSDTDDDNNRSSSSSGSSSSKVGVVPSVLVSEPSRPMPKNDRELKMGSMIDVINSNNNVKGDESTTGLSVKELEMMEFLDKADNMLNSGSFGDFDQLIGDLNDPRLQALRLKRDGADEVKGQLNDVLKELLQLG